MMFIGDSIQEAIDWTQDRLLTTRPLAEQTLFSLIADHAVTETEYGYMLIEAEEEVEKRHHTMRHRTTRNRSRFKFHTKRKNAKQRRQSQMKHLDSCDAADDMWTTDDSSE